MGSQHFTSVSRNSAQVHARNKSTTNITFPMRVNKWRGLDLVAFFRCYITPEYLPKFIKSLTLKIASLIIKVKFQVVPFTSFKGW